VIKISRIKQSCFKVELSEKIIYFDPFRIPDGAEKADLVFISHRHFDHNSKSSIKKIRKENTTIICPITCKKVIKRWNAKGLKEGESIDIEDINIKAFPAYNHKLFLHKRKKGYLGYIVSDDKVKLYHAGDTDLVPEMESLAEQKIDYAMLPCGGIFTMNPIEVVEAVKLINPKNVILMHERKMDLNRIGKKIKELTPNIRVILLRLGERYNS